MASSQFLLAFVVATTVAVFITNVESARLLPIGLCAKADYPGACTEVLKNLFGNKRAALKANIEATVLNTYVASSKIKRLVPTASAGTKSCLTVANEQYDVAATELNTALKAIEEKGMGTAQSSLTAASVAYEDINTCFVEMGAANPFSRPNAFLKELAQNNLYLYDKINV